MKKEKIILKEITSDVTYNVVKTDFYGNIIRVDGHVTITQVDPEKLAKFLAKFVDIKPEDIVE